MADLYEIVEFMDRELRTTEIKDYPGALNGLQLQNDGRVNRIVCAVDASLAVINEAAKEGGLLLVHHGMFWRGNQPITGPFFDKIKAAINGNLAIYSSHLPLDMHPGFGNNMLLARAIGLKSIRPILENNGFPMGVAGEWRNTRAKLELAVKQAVGREIQICPGGEPEIDDVAVITGGAGSELEKIRNLGITAFVTGEGPHWSYIAAEEHKLNVFYAGHYATETFGIKALSSLIGEKFGLESFFIERPGGL